VALATWGILVSILAFLTLIVIALIVARLRRTARKSSELEELRDMTLAAMGYIYRVEVALQQAANKLGVDVDWAALDKPEVLDRKFLVAKARDEGNREIQDLMNAVTTIQEQLKGYVPQLPTKENTP
jgi:hypothetical protein